MRVFVLLIGLFSGIFSFSQQLDSVQQYIIISKIDSIDFESDFRKVIDSCDKYLAYDFSICSYKAGLYAFKAQALEHFLYSVFDSELYDYEDDSINRIIYDVEFEIIKLYDSAIIECPGCKLNFMKSKYEFLTGTQNFIINQKELKELKSFGFKEEHEFWSISPQYFYGNNQWVGVELSVDVLQPKYKIVNVDSVHMIAASGLNVGFRKNISNEKGWGMNFSLASGSYKWINIRPINFSYLNNGDNKSWGYSPELGLQIWYFHLNAGYNIAFKKSMRDYERLYFTAKFDIPFYRF